MSTLEEVNAHVKENQLKHAFQTAEEKLKKKIHELKMDFKDLQGKIVDRVVYDGCSAIIVVGDKYVCLNLEDDFGYKYLTTSADLKIYEAIEAGILTKEDIEEFSKAKQAKDDWFKQNTYRADFNAYVARHGIDKLKELMENAG